MTDIIEIEGGEVFANLEDRTISGRLIPFNEEGRTNVGRFTVEAGSIALPADPAVISLNLDHVRSDVVGRGTRVWEQADGIYASWSIANTPEGDAALADAINPQGQRRRLSAEFGPAIIRAGKLIAGHAKLWGSALVPMGAFPGAMVLAEDTPDEPDRADADNQHPAIQLPELPTDLTVVTPEGETALYTPEATPAEDNPEGESIVTAAETEVLAGAQTPAAPVPPTLAPSAPAAIAEPRTAGMTPRQVFAAIAAVKANPHDADAHQVLAALSDIKLTGNGSLPTGANGTANVIPQNWVGQIYQGEEYAREYIHLGKLGTDITATGKKGYGVKRRSGSSGTTELALTPSLGNWSGEKTEIASYSGFSVVAESTLRRFAVGQDIAREFYDLPGGEEVVEAFLRLVVENHAYWSDQNALADIVTAAGTAVAPATYPSDYPDALGMLIQGILAVKARKANTQRRDVPTFAIANEKAYAELVYAAGGDQNLPAFVNIAVSTNRTGTVDGSVQVVQGNTGIDDTASVIVGDRRAIEFDELPGGPLHINALDLAKGGIDKAVHGYLQTFSVRPEAVVLVGVADA